MSCRDRTAGDVTLELQSVATGRVLLSRNLTAADSAPAAVEDRIADILSSTIPASGTIYSYIEQNGIQNGLTECLLLNDKYYLDQSARTHEAAYRCLENLANQDAKSSLVYSELASLHLEAVTDHYAYPPGATIEQAMSFAHRAVQMGPTSPYAHRAYGYLYSRLGNSDEAIRWMRKAYELNPYDLSMAAAYGYGLIFAGKYAEGTPILDPCRRDRPAPIRHGGITGFSSAQFMLGDMNKATIASDALRHDGNEIALSGRAADRRQGRRPRSAGAKAAGRTDRQVPEIRRRSARDLRRQKISGRSDRPAGRGPACRRDSAAAADVFKTGA